MNLFSLKRKAQTLIDQLDELLNEGREYFDERSERWQESDAGVDYEAALDHIEVAKDELEEAVS